MYSRQYLNRFYDSSLLLTPEHRVMLGELLDMVSNGDKLTIAESCYAAVILPLSVPPIDPRLFPELENGVFDVLYHTYYSYLNGHPKARNAFGLIPAEKQREDVILLERHYQTWKVEIENERHSEEVKKHVAAETRQQLREHKKLTANRGLGSNKLEYDRKSIILQSKMIYLKVAEFYQELGILRQDLTLCGHEIWVDSYSYIHILFRHYFPSLNNHLHKDYHFDQSISFDNLPSYMRQFISRYFTNIDCQCFNRRSIYLRYRGTVYAMYFEPKQVFTGRSKRTVLRLETFFPVSVASLVNHINQMSEKQASGELSFFY
jgi:hypothetical protein